jgi:hypothetical protein
VEAEAEGRNIYFIYRLDAGGAAGEIGEGAAKRRRRLTRGVDRNQRVEMRAHVTQQPVQ